MAASWDSNSTKIRANSISRERFPGHPYIFFRILDYTYIWLYIGYWVIMETQGMQPFWAEAELSNFSMSSFISHDVNQTVSQPEARPQCTHLHFFVSLCSCVIGESGRNHIRCGLQSNSSGSSRLSPCIGATWQHMDLAPSHMVKKSAKQSCKNISI